MELAELMGHILNHACPNGGINDDGSKVFVLETHCRLWRVTADKSSGQWVVSKVTFENC